MAVILTQGAYHAGTGQLRKKTQNIHLNSAVCLNQYVCAGSRRVPATHGQYSLQGVVIHCGRSLDAGHCYSYQLVRDQWYLFNDADVQQTTWADLTRVAAGNRQGHCPTVLFYARIDYVDRGNFAHQPVAVSEQDLHAAARPAKRRLFQSSGPDGEGPSTTGLVPAASHGTTAPVRRSASSIAQRCASKNDTRHRHRESYHSGGSGSHKDPGGGSDEGVSRVRGDDSSTSAQEVGCNAAPDSVAAGGNARDGADGGLPRTEREGFNASERQHAHLVQSQDVAMADMEAERRWNHGDRTGSEIGPGPVDMGECSAIAGTPSGVGPTSKQAEVHHDIDFPGPASRHDGGAGDDLQHPSDVHMALDENSIPATVATPAAQSGPADRPAGFHSRTTGRNRNSMVGMHRYACAVAVAACHFSS